MNDEKEPKWRKPHLKQLQSDRDKEFGLSGAISTEEYVKNWCGRNGLVHHASDIKPKKRRKSAAEQPSKETK